MSTFLVVNNSTFECETSANQPYLKVNNRGFLPLTTETTALTTAPTTSTSTYTVESTGYTGSLITNVGEVSAQTTCSALCGYQKDRQRTTSSTVYAYVYATNTNSPEREIFSISGYNESQSEILTTVTTMTKSTSNVNLRSTGGVAINRVVGIDRVSTYNADKGLLSIAESTSTSSTSRTYLNNRSTTDIYSWMSFYNVSEYSGAESVVVSSTTRSPLCPTYTQIETTSESTYTTSGIEITTLNTERALTNSSGTYYIVENPIE